MSYSIDNSSFRDLLTIMICGMAVFMVVFYFMMKRFYDKSWMKTGFDLCLIALSLASIFAYFEFGWLRFDRYMNPHDVYHYYIGAKYSPEHQYYDLYRCTLIADNETGRSYTEKSIRHLHNHQYEASAEVLKNAATYKDKFTAGRWEEFKKDIAYFRATVPTSKWNQMLKDKGYNATPVWNALARVVCNLCPTDSVWAMRFITYIDLFLLAAMFAMIAWAFGWRIMLFAIIFHCTNYMMSFVHIKGAFARLDWLFCIVGAICLLKMKHYKTAGALTAYAVSARVFPLIFAYGLGLKLLWNLWDVFVARKNNKDARDTFNPDYFLYFMAMAFTLLVLGVITFFLDGSTQLWTNFFDKMEVHNSDMSTNRAGFKYVFMAPWDSFEQMKAGFESHQFLWRAIQLLVLAVMIPLVRKARDYECLALGFIPVYFMTAPTFYYYVMLLVPLFFFLPRLEKPARAFGAALFFAFSCFAFVLGFYITADAQRFFDLSVAMLGLCFYLAAVAAFAQAEDEDKAEPVTSAKKNPPPLNLGKLKPVLPFLAGFLIAVMAGAAVIKLTLDTKSEKAGSSENVTLAFAGDVMLSRNVAAAVKKNNKDFTFPFQKVKPQLDKADIAFCNLECPISGRGKVIEKKYTFNAPKEAIEGLVYADFEVVSLANNHVLDYGPVALEDTVAIVEEKGIKQAGITTENTPQTPVIFNEQGMRIGYLAYCDPVPEYSYAREFYAFPKRPAAGDEATLARDITALRPQVDILVVSMHWGIEYQEKPDAHQSELAHYIIDQGADIVAGHHQHVLQNAEMYKNKLIIHSMGNFVFDQWSRPQTALSRLYLVEVSKSGLLNVRFLPLKIEQEIWQPFPTAESYVSIYEAS